MPPRRVVVNPAAEVVEVDRSAAVAPPAMRFMRSPSAERSSQERGSSPGAPNAAQKGKKGSAKGKKGKSKGKNKGEKGKSGK